MTTIRVKSGDTLGAIAKRHNTTVGAIAKANGIRASASWRTSPAARRRCRTASPTASRTSVRAVEGALSWSSEGDVLKLEVAGDWARVAVS